MGNVTVNLPRDYRQRKANLKPASAWLLTFLTMLGLTVIQEPVGLSWLGWVVLVPWVVGTVGRSSGGRTAVMNWLLGTVYFLGNLYWLSWVTLAGYIGLGIYLGFYFVLGGFVLRQVYLRKRWPFTLVLPLLLVSLEYLRGTVMTGFPWLFMSHSQHEHLKLIQIADCCGAYGVTFILAMVNGFIADLLLRPLSWQPGLKRKPMGIFTLAVLTAGAVAGTYYYGGYRLEESAGHFQEGPTVAVVQDSVPILVHDIALGDEEIFSRHAELSRQAGAGEVKPELVVWPESMVGTAINDEYLKLPETYSDYNFAENQAFGLSTMFDGALRELAKEGAAILVGAPSWEMNEVEISDTEKALDRTWQGNGAYLYLADGTKFAERYDKMHLVPFGEVVPFKKSFPALHDLLNRLTPYDFEYTLDAGEQATVFEYTNNKGQQRRFAVAICYEDVVAEVPRQLSVASGEKRVDFLLNISNDGWFVRGELGEIKPSTENIQHYVICKFRAVENRISIVRAVNTGISGFIRSDGYGQFGKMAGTLADEPRERAGQSGYLVDRVTLDGRVSFYSRWGNVFAILCTVITGLAALRAMGGEKVKTRQLFTSISSLW